MNVFDLFAKLSLDTSDYEKNLGDAEKKGSGFGKGLASAAKVGVAAIGAAATAVGVLSKKSVESYAEYEQLVGGVETLFKKSAPIVQEYASNAYKTAGLSANEYMETVTSFSASLLQSVGGDTRKAAEYADKAITDMSDNANKMGTSMESIQNAYQGFAKQNYTMLDNLKLGYGGTKEEMQRLLDDASKLSGQKFDLSSYADVVEAIHVVQKEMHISGISAEEAAEAVKNGTMTEAEALAAMGTTAKEASSTISGSIGMMKSAWENLVTGFADPKADIGALITDVVSSGMTALDNLIPAFQQALIGIGEAISTTLPDMLNKIPALVDEMVVPLLNSGVNLISALANGFAQGLPTLMGRVVQMLSDITNTISGLSEDESILSGIGAFFESIGETVTNWAPILITAVGNLITAIVENLPTMLEGVVESISGMGTLIVDGIGQLAPTLIEVAMQLVTTLAEGIVTNLPIFIEGISTLISSFAEGITENASTILTAAVEIINTLVTGIVENIPTLIENAGEIVTSLADTIIDLAPQLLDAGVEIILNLVNGIVDNLPKIIDTAVKTVTKFAEHILKKAPELIKSGMELIGKLITGLGKALPKLIAAVPSIIKGIWDTISKVDWVKLGSNILNALIDGLLALIPKVLSAAKDILSSIWDTITNTDWLSLGTNIVTGIIKGIASMGKALIDAVVRLAKSAFDGIAKFFNIKSPSKKMRDEIGKNIVKGMIQGIDDEKKNAKKSAEELGSLYITAAKKKVEALKANNELSLQEEWAYWLEVREHVKKGTQAYDEALSQIAKVKSAIKKEQEDAAKEQEKFKKNIESISKTYTEGVDKITKELDSKITELINTYNETVSKRKDDILKQFSLFDEAKINEGVDKNSLTSNLKSQVDALKTWDSTLNALEGRIGDTDLYTELQNMGVSSLETLKNLNAMTDTELQEYIKLYDEKNRIAQERAVKENEDLKADTDKQIEDLKAKAESDINTLEKEYKKNIKKLGANANKAFKKQGKFAIKGMQEGMDTQMDKLEADMVARAKSLVSAVQSALQIHSPSKVFADDVGKWIPLGISEGFEDAMPKAEDDIISSIDNMKENVSSALDISATVSPSPFEDASSPVVSVLYAIYELLFDMPDDMKAAMAQTSISVDGREFARLVKAV